jgi:hypothetical protein
MAIIHLFVVALFHMSCQLVSSWTMTIVNRDVIELNQNSAALEIRLSFDNSSELSTEIVLDSEPCLLINGIVCKCYASLHFILWTNECIPADWEYLWISLRLLIPGQQDFVYTTAEFMTNRAQDGYLAAKMFSQHQLLTLVLPLTLDDVPRAVTLISSLYNIGSEVVAELLVIVPDLQLRVVGSLVTALCQDTGLLFPCSIFAESLFFSTFESYTGQVHGYAVQMAIKILVSSMIKTQFYLTLDADLVLLRPFSLSDVLIDEADSVAGLSSELHGVFEDEPRSVHGAWWAASSRFLKLASMSTASREEEQQCSSSSLISADCTSRPVHVSNSQLVGNTGSDKIYDSEAHVIGEGFGVTPAILSTYGSLLVVNLIRTQACEGFPIEHCWVYGFGRNGVLWSEYTLYRLALDHLHVRRNRVVLLS